MKGLPPKLKRYGLKKTNMPHFEATNALRALGKLPKTTYAKKRKAEKGSQLEKEIQAFYKNRPPKPVKVIGTAGLSTPPTQGA